MEQIPSKAYWRQILTLVPVYFNCFMAGSSLGWAANAILFFKKGDEITATPYQCELLASCLELGRLILAIPSGILVDRFGRKKITITAGLLNFISWLLLSSTSSIGIILFARFFLGVAIALINSSATVIFGEIASPVIRAKVTSISNIFFSFGILFQSVISISFSSYFILSYSSLALSSLFFITLFWILETPYYLISVSKIQKARLNLEYIRKGCVKEEIDSEFNGMQTYILTEKIEKNQINWLQFIKTKSVRKPLITAVTISFFTSALGTGLVSNFVTIIVPNNSIIPSKYYPIIMEFPAFIFSLIFPLFVEKFPRRMIFQIGIAYVCLNNLFLALTDYFFITVNNNVCKWIFIFLVLSHKLSTSGCAHQMVSAMKSELFPQSVKGFASSLCVVFQALANIILYQSYNLVTANLDQYFIFIILMVNSLILYLIVYFRLPEARGRYLADLQNRSNKPDNFETQTRYGSVGGLKT